MSGTTCTLAIIIDKDVYFGHIGDSLMCISKRVLHNALKNNELIVTKPWHTPTLMKERVRIYNNKGEVRGVYEELRH